VHRLMHNKRCEYMCANTAMVHAMHAWACICVPACQDVSPLHANAYMCTRLRAHWMSAHVPMCPKACALPWVCTRVTAQRPRMLTPTLYECHQCMCQCVFMHSCSCIIMAVCNNSAWLFMAKFATYHLEDFINTY